MARVEAAATEGQPLLGSDLPNRVSVSDSGEFTLADGQELVLLGGNYVVKAQPWYPPVEQVTKDATIMADGAKAMAYTPKDSASGGSRVVKPCVRLGCLMEGAMPKQGQGVDQTWAAKLEATIKAFGEKGVYVILDCHQDAGFGTNAGEGFPWWVTAGMQQNAGFGMCGYSCDPVAECPGCSCCGCLRGCWPSCCQASYVANSERPLQQAFPDCVAKMAGIAIEEQEGSKDPWGPFSVGGDAGDPANMNVGNYSMRLNNLDSVWGARLQTTRQLQNTVTRFYASPFVKDDKALFFDAYVEFTTHLCRLWEKHFNVVAVELLNEPCFGGLPNCCQMLSTDRSLFGFYGEVLKAMDKAEPPVSSPIVLNYWGSCLPGASKLASCMGCCPLPFGASRTIKEWATRKRIILSFHYYAPPTSVSFEDLVGIAKKKAKVWGSAVPIFLSEYWETTAQKFADRLALAADLGCNAVTYWHYVNTEFTGQGGWYKYDEPFSIPATDEQWEWYVGTVNGQTFWGAAINGAAGGQYDVLSKVPSTTEGLLQGTLGASKPPSWLPGAMPWASGPHMAS